MTTPDVVITEFMNEAAVESLSQEYDALYDPSLVDDRSRLLGLLGGARAIVVRNRTTVDPELLAAAPRLQVVGRLGVGLDNIDLAACEERGIAVRPAIGANATAVAEYVIGAILALERGVFWATDRVLEGSWPRTDLKGGEIGGKRLGLVGLGTIAREVADRARALGMIVAAHDPFLPSDDPVWNEVDRTTLEDVLTGSDAISIHVPLTDETRNLIDAPTIAAMRPGSIVVNTARGGIIDEDALVAALRSGHLGGAAIDVFAEEPVDERAASRMADTPNLILTPHIAGITNESDVRVGSMTADHVRRALTGEQRS
jgi:(S)-sulfolactate dehydrogenase